jgi:transcriptional regulator GlxA family with amidase domain
MRPHRVVVAAFAPVQALDVTGPLEVFAMANQVLRRQGAAPAYELQLASLTRGPLATTTGVPLVATRALARVRADTLLVAGGPGARALRHDARGVRELRAACERTPRVGSVCTGAFALAATGLLQGGRVTTHWAHFDEFAAVFPGIAIERDALFVHGPRFHSAAGVTAGIDYALSLVEIDLGRPVALQVAQALVVFLKRPGGQSQFSAELAAEAAAPEPQRFASLLRWMQSHLANDLSVPALADRAAMSPRNFARRFQEAMGTTPARYVQRLRLDAARRLLTSGRQPLARVAQRCGFASEEAMRIAFRKHLGTAPGEFRARFRTSASAAP